MKITVLDGYAENPGDLSWDGFRGLGELTVYDRTDRTNEGEIIRRIGDARAVITNKTPLSRAVIESCPFLRYIGVLATGYNVVDCSAAAEHGIPVTNIPNYGTQAVGQFAVALLLEICNRIGHHDQAVKAGRWQESQDFCFWDYPLMELAGKTMGIVGYGRIGQVTGRLAQALGMEVLACSAHRRPETEPTVNGVRMEPLEEVLRQSDVISLHCPLSAQTEGLINRKTIAAMKDGVIIINTARGQLIREHDLAEALNSGKVYAAGLDVLAEEPARSDNPLLAARNCIVTPHIAWASRESRKRLMDIAVENLQAFVGGAPVNVVNGIEAVGAGRAGTGEKQ